MLMGTGERQQGAASLGILPNIASSVFSLLSSVSCLRPHLGIIAAFALISHRRH